MKRFHPITKELSLIREKHRVLVQFLRLTAGHSVSSTAALTKDDLRRACESDPEVAQVFENELGQLSWSRGTDDLQLRFLDRGRLVVEVLLSGPELRLWNEAMQELAPGS